MPRFLSLHRRPASDPPPPGTGVRRTLPAPSLLRRERRTLLRLREDRIRDLGGLMLEMFRRDQFRQDLLVDRCAELAALEDRLTELDVLLSTVMSLRHRPAARCTCGAPIMWGAHFCPSCGKAVGPAEQAS
ncbi:MAG: hypothetical protein ABR569_06595 [Gaiellaceae bacterium]